MYFKYYRPIKCLDSSLTKKQIICETNFLITNFGTILQMHFKIVNKDQSKSNFVRTLTSTPNYVHTYIRMAFTQGQTKI